MTTLIPAVLPDRYEDLEAGFRRAAAVSKAVHFDVCDGVFVPRRSWPYHPTDRARFDAIKSKAEGMPQWETLNVEVHAMVSRPERSAKDWLSAGATRFVPHVEAVTDFEALFLLADGAMQLGLALLFDTPLDAIAPYADRISVLQLMTIRRAGFQGSEFADGAFERVREAKRRFPLRTTP